LFFGIDQLDFHPPPVQDVHLFDFVSSHADPFILDAGCLRPHLWGGCRSSRLPDALLASPKQITGHNNLCHPVKTGWQLGG
jgi:hypothetical protein